MSNPPWKETVTVRGTPGAVISVLGLTPNRIGGMEIFARELSSQLRDADRKSVLCYLSDPEQSVRQFLELSNVKIETLADSFAPSFAVLQRMASIFTKYRPAVVHFHLTPCVSPYPWLAKLLGTKAIFVTDHFSRDAGSQPIRAPLWKRLLIRPINAPLNRLLCVSEFNRRCWLQKGGFPPNRIHRLYNGVDLSSAAEGAKNAWRFRHRFGIPRDRIVIMQVGWMIPEKGFADLLHSVKRVLAKNKNIQLVLVGDGPQKNEYLQLAKALRIEAYVTFTGVVHDPLADGAFAAADVVCQLSQWEEAFGLTIAEAMAAGKPLVANRVGAIPELVTDGVTGFLTSRGDIAAIAERIELLAADSELCKKLGRNGRAVCEDKFDVKKNVAELLDYYYYALSVRAF